jgi:hypothetical protein
LKRNLSALFLIALVGGCTSGHFGVLVRDLNHRPISGASVLLYAGMKTDVCDHGPIGGQGTDAHGEAFVHARGCGEDRLMIAAEGYQPVMRVIDTCATFRDLIFIELKARPQDPQSSDEMVKTARLLMSALNGKAAVPLAPLLADSEDSTLYYEGGRLDSPRAGCEMHFVRALPSAADPRVEFAFECDDGCRALWQVHMVRQGEEWRVRAITPASKGFQPPPAQQLIRTGLP